MSKIYLTYGILIALLYFLFMSNKQELVQDITSLKEVNSSLSKRLVESESNVRDLILRMNNLEGDVTSSKSLQGTVELTGLYEEVKKSVYQVLVEDVQSNISQGTAFCVSRDGLMISNYHVFKKASEVILKNESGELFMVSDIVDFSKENDFVLFKVGPLRKPLSFLDFAKYEASVGESVFAIGNPEGLTQTLSTGIVSGIRGNKYQIAVPITHGSSGGPLLNNMGKVVGITSGGIKGGGNLNFAIKISSVLGKDYSLEESTGSPKRSLDTTLVLQYMNEYYNALKSKDFNFLNETYEDTLSRFHSNFETLKADVLKEHKSYLVKYDVIKADINTSSIILSTSDYFATFEYQLDWHIKKRSSGKVLKYSLETIVIVDNNEKIIGIFDSILKKKPSGK